MIGIFLDPKKRLCTVNHKILVKNYSHIMELGVSK